MALVNELDVYEGVKAGWDADTVIVAAVPGGLNAQRKPARKSWPFAVCRVTADGFEGDSSRIWLQTFLVEITLWTDTRAVDARPVMERLDVLFGEWTLVVPNANRVIRCWPRPGKFDLASELRQGQDVLAAAARWNVKVEATRG